MRTRRSKIELAERRQFILDASRRLLAKQGVDNTSMDDIAREAGYTRRTIYAYFNSADEIRLKIFTADLIERWELQKRRIAVPALGLDKLIAWAEALYDFSKENTEATHLQAYWDYRGIDRRRVSRASFVAFEAVNEELAEGLRAIFRLGIGDGSLRPNLQIDMCISQFLHSLRGVIHRALSTAYSFATFDSDEYVAYFLELFTRSICNVKGEIS
jgi:AcrR family transcriptional regulator